MAVGYIKGVQDQGISACVKHYAANNQETKRNRINVEMSERALREIYLPGFKAAVQEGGVNTLMGSYNNMQSQAQEIKEAHSNTIVSMQKRVDLANKLVDIASSYGDHEKLTQITVAQNESVQAAMSTSQEVDGTVNRILSMARAYPDLKANQTYQTHVPFSRI